jgi:hypothetical protein
MEDLGGDSDGMSFEMPMLMNQPPQIFGAYKPDGSPMTPVLSGPIFTDDLVTGTTEESNEAKRRRIARVSAPLDSDGCGGRTDLANRYERRHVICVGRRRLNATGGCPSARTASTTRQNASLHRWKRSGTPPKGMASALRRSFNLHSD